MAEDSTLPPFSTYVSWINVLSKSSDFSVALNEKVSAVIFHLIVPVFPVSEGGDEPSSNGDMTHMNAVNIAPINAMNKSTMTPRDLRLMSLLSGFFRVGT